MVCNRCGSGLVAGDAPCARCATAQGAAVIGAPSQVVAPRAIDPLFGGHWVVVALAAAGSLATVAPGLYRRHLTSEAEANLQRIFDAEVRYFNWSSENSVAQFVSARPTPLTVPTTGGYLAAPSAWTRDPGWRALGFTISGPHRYQYRVETTEPMRGFTATAIGDLDGDGVLSTFSRSAFLTAGQIEGSLVEVVNQDE
ncbi:MAG: hypothetical protein JWM10_235 [Myxococcaceae bacterium]|nr:hypothetical protein [Myxococcaceae bacterium]